MEKTNVKPEFYGSIWPCCFALSQKIVGLIQIMMDKVRNTLDYKNFVLIHLHWVELYIGILHCPFKLIFNRENPWIYLFENQQRLRFDRLIKLFLGDLFPLISPFKFLKLWVIITDNNEISKAILLVIMLKTLCFDYAIREKGYINFKSLEGKNFFKLLLMLSLSDTLFGIICILAFASTWLLIPAAPWWDNLKNCFGRFNWTLSRMMGMGGRNNAVCIIGYELVIS